MDSEPNIQTLHIADSEGSITSGRAQPTDVTIRDDTTHQGSIWFEDGNIVLQAGDKQFRVHRSLLARCSSVFKDIFSLPQPPGASESTTAGLPIIQVHDSPADLTHLLTAIYDHPNSSATATADIVPLPLAVVSALLRLGHKYDTPHLRDNALYRLKKEYAPPDYDALKFGGFIYLVNHKGIHFDMVNLFHEEGIVSALPLALYEVINLETTEAVFDGTERDDGTRATLPPTLLRNCLLAKDKLIDMLSSVVYAWLLAEPVQVSCTQRKACALAFRKLTHWIWIPHPKVAFVLAYDWDDITGYMEENGGSVCAACAENGKSCTEAGKKQVWEALPSVFGLGSWEEVKRLDRQW